MSPAAPTDRTLRAALRRTLEAARCKHNAATLAGRRLIARCDLELAQLHLEDCKDDYREAVAAHWASRRHVDEFAECEPKTIDATSIPAAA